MYITTFKLEMDMYSVSGDVARTHSSFELCGVVFICVELHKLPEFSEICVLPDTCSCCDP